MISNSNSLCRERKSLGFSVDFAHHAPDFVAYKGKDQVCIEAAIASHAEGAIPEWDLGGKLRAAKEVDRKTIIESSVPRLSNALASKHRLYVKSYSSLQHVKGRPFIVALAPFDQPFSYIQTDQAMRNVLYQYDMPIYKDVPEENRRLIFGHEFLEYFIKPNGTKIELGVFLDGRMKEISGVMFSNLATWGKVRAMCADPNPNILFASKRFNEKGVQPRQRLLKKQDYQESLLDGIHIFLNPNAEIPVPPSMLNWPDVVYHSMGDEGIPLDSAKDGAIYWRMVTTLDPDKDFDRQIAEINKYVEEEMAKHTEGN